MIYSFKNIQLQKLVFISHTAKIFAFRFFILLKFLFFSFSYHENFCFLGFRTTKIFVFSFFILQKFLVFRFMNIIIIIILFLPKIEWKIRVLNNNTGLHGWHVLIRMCFLRLIFSYYVFNYWRFLEWIWGLYFA